MSETKFTPGPWSSFQKHKYREWHVGLPCSDTKMKVALFPDGVPGDDDDEKAANAHLIAAAPDMYAALEAALDEMRYRIQDHDETEFYPACPICKVRKALALARGEK